jgi:hypothetical protein
VKWDIFSGRRGEKKSAELDQMGEQIKRIEKFAPRKYKSERASFYYNYQLVDAYVKPLSALLGVISQEKRLHNDEEDFISELFLRLEDFYDVKQRLSLAEAIQDKNLQRRFVQLFLIFYDRKDVAKLKTCLEKLETAGQGI